MKNVSLILCKCKQNSSTNAIPIGNCFMISILFVFEKRLKNSFQIVLSFVQSNKLLSSYLHFNNLSSTTFQSNYKVKEKLSNKKVKSPSLYNFILWLFIHAF